MIQKRSNIVISLFVCFLLLLMNGCSLFNGDNAEYKKIKSFFPEKFVNHFPKKLKKNNITYLGSYTPDAGLLRLDLINKLNDKQLEVTKNAIAIYEADKECLLVANRFASLENYSYNIVLSEKDERIIDLECYNDLFPVPNFWHHDYTTDETECKLPKDFTLYVLEAKSGKFVADSLLTDGRFMPKEWKNGYSNGVAISEEKSVIIYWMIIW